MNYWDTVDQEENHNKWSDWTMAPKKQPRKMTDYVSGIVFLTSGIYAFGIIGM